MRIIHFDTVTSTNDVAKELIRAGRVSEPVCVSAREQSAGRGTADREWVSPRDAGIYISIIDPCGGQANAETTQYTQAAGVACAEVLHGQFGIDVTLRGINDLYVGERKLGGILTETLVERGRLLAVITGVGINTRRAERMLPADAAEPITLEEIVPVERLSQVDGDALLFRLADAIERWNRVVCGGNSQSMDQAVARWRQVQSRSGDRG